MKKRSVIRKQIRFLMYGHGLDTKQLAEKAGLSVSHTRNLISGVFSSAPGRRKIEKVLNAYVWSDPEIGAYCETGTDQDGGLPITQPLDGNDLEQGTRQSQPDDLPLRSGAISAGEAADIQRPTAALLPVSNEADQEGEG